MRYPAAARGFSIYCLWRREILYFSKLRFFLNYPSNPHKKPSARTPYPTPFYVAPSVDISYISLLRHYPSFKVHIPKSHTTAPSLRPFSLNMIRPPDQAKVVTAQTPLSSPKDHPIVPHPPFCTTNPAQSGPINVPRA